MKPFKVLQFFLPRRYFSIFWRT